MERMRLSFQLLLNLWLDFSPGLFHGSNLPRLRGQVRTRELEATLKTMTKDLEQATSRMNLFEKKLQDSRSELALLKGTPDVSRETQTRSLCRSGICDEPLFRGLFVLLE